MPHYYDDENQINYYSTHEKDLQEYEKIYVKSWQYNYSRSNVQQCKEIYAKSI